MPLRPPRRWWRPSLERVAPARANPLTECLARQTLAHSALAGAGRIRSAACLLDRSIIVPPMVNVNVQLRNEAVRRFLAAFEDDDDAFRQTLDPEIEWCPIEENRVPLHGVEA